MQYLIFYFISLITTISTENGFQSIAINCPNNISVDITLYTINDITDIIKEQLIGKLYESLNNDKFY